MDPATLSLIASLAGPVLNDVLGGGGQAAQQAALLAAQQAAAAQQQRELLIVGGALALGFLAIIALR